MPTAPAAAFRVARGCAVTVVGASLAVAGHGLAMGGPPDVGPLTVLAVLLLGAGLVVSSARSWTLGRLLAALAGVQVVVHASLWVGGSGGAIDPRLRAVSAHQQAHVHVAAGTASSVSAPTMLLGHVAAALLAAALLCRIDDAVRVLVELARRLVAPRGTPGRPTARPALWYVARRDLVMPTSLLTVAAWGRRGPPALAPLG